MNELGNVLNQLRKASWKKGKFGLGCVQWTGERTLNLFKKYIPTIAVAIICKSLMAVFFIIQNII